MNKVYVTQETMHRDKDSGMMVPRFDVTPAAVYGDIEFLTPTKSVALLPAPTIRALKHKLRNFTDEDYILPTGDPVIIAMVTLVAAMMNTGRVKMLKWDRLAGAYITIQVDTGV